MKTRADWLADEIAIFDVCVVSEFLKDDLKLQGDKDVFFSEHI